MVGMMIGVLLLAGCGGGGSAGAPSAKPIATNTLRTFTSGDRIQYSLAGNINSGGISAPVSGTASYAITTSAAR